MKVKILIFLFFVSGFTSVSAKQIFAATTGTTTGAGTIVSPNDIVTAISKASAGDTVYVRGGQYMNNTSLTFVKSGNSSSYLNIWAYADEMPVFDFRNQPYNSSNPGIKISGSYVHVKGITVQGAGDNGMFVTGSNNRIEKCIFRWNCDSGLQLKAGSNNLIVNCDSYENFDYQTGGTTSPDYGGNADGFADKQYTNSGTNTYVGCRSWLNSDDGWDHYQKIGNTIYDSCWCYANGPASYDMTEHIRFRTDSASWFSKFKNTSGRYVITNYGNGNGFKLGGDYTAHNATLRNCISVKNKVKGFDQNNDNGTMILYNCTGYLNQRNYGFTNSSYGKLVIKNSASLSSTTSNSFTCKEVNQEYNTWNAGFSCNSADFVSLDYTQLLSPRKADGSLPEISLLHLVSTSSMIDKGTNLGLAYSGLAPDLGAFEFNAQTAVISPCKTEKLKVYFSNANKEIIVSGFVSKVEIFDISAKKIFEIFENSENLSIPASDWAKGTYLIRVFQANTDLSVYKIILP